ncbi:glyoxalase/bleomycin resistance protein/dioxygenase [Glonium stellatum]|uniref:Glyoxalase/bleomycin resistance protein/dioxygenase n=1 Tax=Glonium stellatum TaxID=574774 RepID=A0A8E2ETX3_9PEZI|nr:glyoxalase/bleomycin resistance protein/dioxygenase [Glonium stellatum]
MSLDHIGLTVPPAQYDSTITWYLAALAPLGFTKQVEFPGAAVGLGPSKAEAVFWIASKADAKPGPAFHLAFRGKDREAVDRFHEEAVRAGGTCNGEPGVRAHYHPGYYAAFVLDLVGNNIEVVNHGA